MLAMRASILDDFTKDFLNNNPSCLVLHLGCGLDSRFMRLGVHVGMWYDLDFPEVIDIKNNYIVKQKTINTFPLLLQILNGWIVSK